MGLSKTEQIRAFYRVLFRAWGRQHWWPAQSRFEVIAGAFLTQNTAWTNVQKAMAQLRRGRALSLAGMRKTPTARLEQLIRSAGYFRQKAQRLKHFVRHLDSRYSGSLDRMFARPTAELREELLALNGIGPETADSILLYAGNHAVFVVDAYTRRILERHRILPVHAPYEDIRQLFEQALGEAEFVGECHLETAVQRPSNAPQRPKPMTLPVLDGAAKAAPLPIAGPQGSCHSPSRMSTARRTATAQVFNEMHGLMVGVGKNFCLKSKPLCQECPLREFLPVSGPRIREQARKKVTEGSGDRKRVPHGRF